ncbi:MAG: family oxidoreductase [Hyphomicrobiales bacterium]|jgi:3-oxoacyl-[acyl-carrier protein] reductase|nr:family oxidoreductase [Hyphomicrobiales bacterium]
MKELAGRTALVTGAARNIGRAIAIDLARAGAAVGLIARADRAGLDETAAMIRAEGGRAETILADLTDEALVAAAVAQTHDVFGSLDILVNNAALRSEAVFEDITLAQWRAIFSVNLEAAFLTSQAALPHLRRSDAAAIVHMGGLTAYTGARHRAHVVAAKAGLDGLTKAMAQDLAEDGITVNLVSPGLIDTARGGRSAAQPDHHKHHATLLGRRGRPEEVAAMVRHLAGPNGRYITGQTIHVNGGVFLP